MKIPADRAYLFIQQRYNYHVNKLRALPLPAILLISFMLGASVLTRGHEWGDDWASYVMQAQSILSDSTDKFMERNAFTIFESSVQIGPVAYPWGYPLILTPVLLLKGIHALTLKLPGLFFFAGFLIFFYFLMKTRLSHTGSLLLLSLFAFNPTMIGFLDYIISDIPFLFSVFLVLLLFTKPDMWRETGTYILLGIAIFFAFFIRTTGIILLAGFLACQTLDFYRDRARRKGIALNSAITVVFFVLPWLITSYIFPNGQGSYFQQLGGFTYVVLLNNLHDYFFVFIQFFGSSPPWTYIYYILVAFFLIGAWMQRRIDQALVVFFALYSAVMLVWPEWQGIRFIFPLLPIFVYFAFQGMRTAVGVLPTKSRSPGNGMVYLFWLVIAGIFLFNSGLSAYTNLNDNRQINGPFDSYSDEVFAFIREETPPDSIIVFFKPRVMRLFTDRDSIMSVECDRLMRGDYIVLHKTWEYSQILPDEIQNCDLPLEITFENRRFIVYELLTRLTQPGGQD